MMKKALTALLLAVVSIQCVAQETTIPLMFDPVSVLFIPLGHTVAEALETMQKIQALFNEPEGTSIEVPGCLAVVFPNDELETVRITLRKPLLSTLLEFSVQRQEHIRATHIPKGQFNSLVGGVKFYGKLRLNN